VKSHHHGGSSAYCESVAVWEKLGSGFLSGRIRGIIYPV